MDNDRVGSKDSSLIIADKYLSLYSNQSVVGKKTTLSLKLPFDHISRIENKLGTVFITTCNNKEFRIPTDLIIQSDVSINLAKIKPLFELLQEIISSTTTKCNASNIKFRDELDNYYDNYEYPFYDPFISYADKMIEEGQLIIARDYIKKAWEVLNKQVGTDSFAVSSHPLFNYIYQSNEDIEVIESKYYHKTGDSYTGLCRLDEINRKFKDVKSNKLEQALSLHKQSFKKDFFELPQERRKVVVITDQLPTEKTKTYLQLNKEIVPSKDIFPHSNPKTGEIYVAHPYKSTHLSL
ncbi:MAG: hypothetical protein WBG46_05865 [Nonlabens sp.]